MFRKIPGIVGALFTLYRIYTKKRFLIWTWSKGGPVRYIWNEGRWDGHEG